MSVLIKGMEMPTGCRACHLKINCDDCEGFECVCVPLYQQIGYLDDLLTDKRRDDCPLVPVPPHGRLIDADALDNTLGIDDRDDYVHWTLDDAPTIIPAEETNKEAANDQNNS